MILGNMVKRLSAKILLKFPPSLLPSRHRPPSAPCHHVNLVIAGWLAVDITHTLRLKTLAVPPNGWIEEQRGNLCSDDLDIGLNIDLSAKSLLCSIRQGGNYFGGYSALTCGEGSDLFLSPHTQPLVLARCLAT